MRWTWKAIVLLASALTASAQEGRSLAGAAKTAMERNPSLQALLAQQDAARARVAVARSGKLPKVNYSESWTRSDNPVFVFSSLLTQRQFTQRNFDVTALNRPDFLNNFQSLVTGDQPIFDGGKARRAVRLSELSQNMTAEEQRRQSMAVVAQVARSYWDAQLASQQVQVADQALRSAQADLERAEARRSAGMATDADVLSIRVHVARVQEERIQHQADLDVARAALNDAMGLPLEDDGPLATALTPLPLPAGAMEEVEATAAGARPEIRQAQLGRDMADTRMADARAAFLPEVSVRGAFEADRRRFYNQGGANWLVSAGVRWNLFNGGADKARLQEAEAARRQSTAEKRRAESAVRLQVRQAWATLRAAQQRLVTAGAATAAAEESLRISQNRYAAGLATVTDLLRTEIALTESRTRHLAAIHDQRVAAAMLELAAGTLSPESEVLK